MLRQFNKRIRGSKSRKKVSGATLIPDKKDEIMSVANQLRKEGLQEGKRQGKKEGKKEGIFTVARNKIGRAHV